MIVQPYDYALYWFVISGFSTAAYDQFANNPEPTVMKWGFILITLYCGHSIAASTPCSLQDGCPLFVETRRCSRS